MTNQHKLLITNIMKLNSNSPLRLFAKTSAVILSCACFLIPSLAQADAPSFSYVELEYIAKGDINVSDEDLSVSAGADGFAFNASAELGIFLLQASRLELESDKVLDSNLQDSISSLAFGLTLAFPRTAVYGLLRARRDDLSLTGGGFDEDESGNSLGMEAGVRMNLTDKIEINANVGTLGFGEGSSFGIGAQYYLLGGFGVTLDHNSIEVEEGDVTADIDTTSIGLRFSF